MQRWLFNILLFSAVLTGFVSAETTLFQTSSEPPPGFDSLGSPQRTLVDVYYGNRFLLSQWVVYTRDTVELSDPQAIIDKLSDLRNTALMLDQLQGVLDSHPDHSCAQALVQKGCGTLHPNIVGVIFDEESFRLDIFVNPDQLNVRPAPVQKYLPESDGRFALMQNMSATASGFKGEKSSNDYTLLSKSILSWRENSLSVQADYSKEHKVSVSELYGQRNFEGLDYRAGLMTSRSLFPGFSHNQFLTGVSIATSFVTRMDDQFSRGTPINLYVPSRGRIEIRKDDRLISTDFLEAGTQQLDTSQFPEGAYNMEIRLVDESGRELLRETRFFAKRYQLPPVGEWVYFAESGQIMTRNAYNLLPQNTRQWMGRAGVNRRLSETWSGSVAIASDHQEKFMELGVFKLGAMYDLSGTLMKSTRNAHGAALNGQLRVGKVSFSADYRGLWRTNPIPDDSHSLLGNGFESRHLSASFPLLTGNLGYRYGFNTRPEEEENKTHSLDYRTQLFRTLEYDVDIDVELGQSDGRMHTLVSLSFQYRKDRWNLSVSPSAGWKETEQGYDTQKRMRVYGSWRDNEMLPEDLEVTGNAEVAERDISTGGAVKYGNRFGSGKLSLNHRTGQHSTTSWGGYINTNFLTDGNAVALGGQNRAESAVVINTNGRPGDVFNVEVNGHQNHYAVAGESSVIPLRPFQRYRVNLSSGNDTFYSIAERERLVTLYPGNVVTLDYKTVSLVLMYGRLMLNGEPIANARLQAGEVIDATDETGLFQVEARTDSDYLSVEHNTLFCQIPIPQQTDYVIKMGTLNLESGCFKPQ